MADEIKSQKNSLGTTLAYGCATLADNTASQFFAVLIFVFYYAVMGLNVVWFFIAMIIWSIWNAINDPIMGSISDKTNSKWGRRKPWIIAGIIPLCVMLVLLWTPPAGSDFVIFIYLLVTVMLFDMFFTMFSLNQTALFPEMYIDLKDRAKANNILQIFAIFSLVFATILPSFFIPEYDNPQYKANYITAGIVTAIIVGIAATIFIVFGIKEKEEFTQDSIKAPSFFVSFKNTMKNKAFVRFVIANLMVFYVIGMLPMVNPLYASLVLGISNSLTISLLLALTFISAAIFMVLWRYISIKHGVKKGHILAMLVSIVCLFPLMFLAKGSIILAFIFYFIIGIGLAGVLFFRAVTISTVIDYDEVNTGVRTEGTYYGINALITRLATIAVTGTIALVFLLTGAEEYSDTPTPEVIFGLRLLMFLFPALALTIGIISMLGFPITKEKYAEIKAQINTIHEKKREALKSS